MPPVFRRSSEYKKFELRVHHLLSYSSKGNAKRDEPNIIHDFKNEYFRPYLYEGFFLQKMGTSALPYTLAILIADKEG